MLGLKANCNGLKIDAHTEMPNSLQKKLVLSMWCDLIFSFQVEVRLKVQVELEATLLSQAESISVLPVVRCFALCPYL